MRRLWSAIFLVALLVVTSHAQSGRVLTLNSTSTPLGGGGVYTGGFEDVLQAGAVVVTIKSDVAGAVNGVRIDWSSDCSTTDYTTATNQYTDTTNGQSFAFPSAARCVRVVYTNGAGAQSSFRLQTVVRDNLYASPAAAASTVDLTKVGGVNVSGANVVDAANTAFRVNCVTGCSAAGSFTDNTAFTAGGSTITNLGGVFNDGLAAVTSGNAAAGRITAQRGQHVNLRNNAGTEIATTSNPLNMQGALLTGSLISGSERLLATGVSDASGNWQPAVNPIQTGTATLQSGATANGNGTPANVTVYSSAVLQVNCSGCSGGTTVNFEGEIGGNYSAISANQVGTSTIATSTTTAGVTQWILPVAGYFTIRARISAYSAGTISVDARFSSQSHSTLVANVNASQVGGPWTQNITQFGSNNVVTGTGASGVGIPRVTISNDSSLAANQSVNVAQFGATNVSTGTGASGAGIPRVTVANDSNILATQSGNWTARIVGNAGATLDSTVGAGTAPTNMVAVGGVFNSTEPSPTTGQALAMQLDSKGRQRQVIMDASGNTRGANVDANNNLTVGQATAANLNVRTDTSGATAAAPPARAEYTGGLGSGATGGFLIGVTVCDSSKVVNVSTATTTLMVTGVSGRQVRICAISLVTAAANNVALIEGTGATCGTGTAGMSGGTTAASGWNFAANGGLTLGSGLGEVITTATTGDSVCIVTSAATQLSGFIKYAIY